jgi:PhnB protein
MTIATTITPFLTVKDAKSAFEFYAESFGATITEQEEMPNGGMIGKVIIDSAFFWVGGEEPQFGNNSPKSDGESGVRIILTVDDPDTIFSKAIRAGAKQICPVTTEEYWRIGKLSDPFGHIWEIGRPLR